MTTTIFKSDKSGSSIASDSRVTLVDKYTNLPIQWFDNTDFLKSLCIDNVLYGFAGANTMFKQFLINYTTKEESENLLDSLVEVACQDKIQFFIMRFDGTLKLFAYSPPDLSNPNSDEIYRVSTDPIIDKSTYAIGSGKYSKEYKKNIMNKNAQVPIRKIISANVVGLKKAGMVELSITDSSGPMTTDVSEKAFFACLQKGGDLFTGGEVRMTKHANKEIIDNQISVLDNMDMKAKAVGAVCASPVNASFEVAQLKSLGQYAVSPRKFDASGKNNALINRLKASVKASIG